MSGMLDITRLSGAIPSLQADRQEKMDTASAVEQAKDKLGPASETRLSAVRMDEYVPGENPVPIGLYQVTQDGDGSRKVIFDAPAKEEGEPKTVPEAPEPPEEETPADASEKADKKVKSESCTCNTDRVDREIKRLKEKQKELELKVSRCKENPDERAKLEHQLARVESELRVKDTDFYRRQHAQFTYS